LKHFSFSSTGIQPWEQPNGY